MNGRFPILSTLSVLLRIFGILAVVAGVIALVNVFQTHGLPQPWEDPTTQSSVAFAAGVVSVVFGLTSAMAGETIGVLFAIEKNTRPQESQSES